MNRSADRPYPGARPFRHGEQGRFFGRATETATLADLWRANHLTIMYGHVGCGKSSLLSAAVLPKLRENNLDVLATGRLLSEWSYPCAALPSHNPYTLSLLRSWSPGGSSSSLAGVTVREFIAEHTERSGRTVFAVIDQAEELFASTEPSRRAYSRRFLRELVDTLQESSHPPRLHLLISVRESTLDFFTAELGNGAPYHLGPLDYPAALDAVTRPLSRTSRRFAPGAAEKLVRGLVTDKVETAAENRDRSFELGHVEPALLQIVCERLWELLSDEVSAISERDILRYGDADAALAAYWGDVIAAVAASHGISVEQLHTWLVRTFVTEMGTRGTAYEGLSETAGMPNTVARAFVDGYLLTTERRSSAIWYQLLTERFVEPLRRAPVIWPPPVGPDDYLQAAGRAYALGEFIAAKNYAEDVLRVLAGTDFRRLAQANSLLGNVAYERGRPAEAAKHYRAAAGLYEATRDSTAVASQLAAVGQMLLAQGKIPDAVDELRAAVDRAPQDLAVQTKLGWALWEMGQRQAAVEVLSGVLAVDGSTAEAVRVRGEILADLGHPRDALRDLDRMAQDEWPSARAARGLARTELGEPGAEKDIESALADAPRNGSVLLYAARAKALAGDKAAAVELARHALHATDPPLPQHQREAALQMVG